MARTVQKETALTAEEKLTTALVSEKEQPYQVPENWCWTRLAYLIATSKEKTEDFSDPLVKYVGLENMEKDTGVVSYGFADGIKSLKNVFSKGQILYGKLRPYLNKHDVATFDGVCSTDILVFDVRETATNKYVNYFFNQQSFIEYTISNSKGINLPRVSEKVVLDSLCPLPPLAEQQRIVDRIESLFAKLDEAKEKAQAVVDGFEDRKAAILHKAFTGELTADWRRNNHITTDQWSMKSFSSVTENHDSKRIPLSKEERANLERRYDYYGASGVIDQVDRYIFDGKYLLIGEDGANLVTRSKPIAFIAEGQYWVNNHAHILSTRQDMVMEFLCFYINSISLLPYVTGSAQPKMTQAKMNTIPVPAPPIEEQIEIVQVLNNLIEKQEQASGVAEQVIDQIDTMKKSILARAFRGELGTNDPADESAEELLKRVL